MRGELKTSVGRNSCRVALRYRNPASTRRGSSASAGAPPFKRLLVDTDGSVWCRGKQLDQDMLAVLARQGIMVKVVTPEGVSPQQIKAALGEIPVATVVIREAPDTDQLVDRVHDEKS